MTRPSEDGDADLGVTPISNATFPALTTSPLTTPPSKFDYQICFDDQEALKPEFRPAFFNEYAQKGNFSGGPNLKIDHARSIFFNEEFAKIVGREAINSRRTDSSGGYTFMKGDNATEIRHYVEFFYIDRRFSCTNSNSPLFEKALNKMGIKDIPSYPCDSIPVLEKLFLSKPYIQQYVEAMGPCGDPTPTASQRDCFDRDGFLKDDLKPDYFRDYAQRNNLSQLLCEGDNIDFDRSIVFSENLYKMEIISENKKYPCNMYSSGNNTRALIVTFYKKSLGGYADIAYNRDNFSLILSEKLNITIISDRIRDQIYLLEKHFLNQNRPEIQQYAQSRGFCLAPADATAAPRGKRNIPEAPISQKSQIGGYDVSWKGAWEGFSDEWKKSFNGTYATLKKGISTARNKIDRLWSHLTNL